MGVLIGVFPGGWLCEHSEYCQLGKRTTAFNSLPFLIACIVVLAKLVLGTYYVAQALKNILIFFT